MATTTDNLQPTTYVELHCHSCFSFREGASTPLELILTARELGYDALALTDHNALAGAMIFAQEARDWEFKAIIGAEITLAPRLVILSEAKNLGGLPPVAHAKAPPVDRLVIQHPTSNIQHLTMLAETPRGYANISRLISYAHLNSPRDDIALDPSKLALWAEGIIALSGCRESAIARLAAADAINDACDAAVRYADIYGHISCCSDS